VLRTIVQEQGGMSEEATEAYIQMLSDKSRYQRDVY
jgi:sulfite reductase alpha subunit-like flavoprotein